MYFVKKNKHQKFEYNVIEVINEKVKLENGLKTTVSYFFRQKIKYYWRKDEKKFSKVKPFLKQPIKNIINNPEGIWIDDTEKALMEKNNLVFPLPEFRDLFKQQITDPLSFF